MSDIRPDPVSGGPSHCAVSVVPVPGRVFLVRPQHQPGRAPRPFRSQRHRSSLHAPERRSCAISRRDGLSTGRHRSRSSCHRTRIRPASTAALTAESVPSRFVPAPSRAPVRRCSVRFRPPRESPARNTSCMSPLGFGDSGASASGTGPCACCPRGTNRGDGLRALHVLRARSGRPGRGRGV